MSIALSQILELVGKLDDTPGNETPRERFRRYLADNVVEIGEIRDYVGECLRVSGDMHYRALQDLVNHTGRFLGFDVVFGRYQGTVNQIGFDGHWKSPTGFHIIVEVKTTDAYAIQTKTVVGYIDALISAKEIPSWEDALGLYVVGRPDASLKQLDNAIVAEKRTGHLRIVSVESLLAIADIASSYGVSHETILTLLRPSGPRVDPIVELITSLLSTASADTPQPAPSRGREFSVAAPIAVIAEPKGPASKPDQLSKRDDSTAAFWLTPVKSTEEESAEDCVNTLVGSEKIYAFGVRTPGRKKVKPGDWICFYATTIGVVAHARVASYPEHRSHPAVIPPQEFPWVFRLEKPVLYLESPVAVDASMRAQLDAFQGKDQLKSWAWFVQATHQVSEHDFRLLTRTGV